MYRPHLVPGVLGFFALHLLSAPATAQDTAATAPPSTPSETTSASAPDADELEWKGRVFFLGQHLDRRLDSGAGAEIDERGFSTSVPSARFGVRAKVRPGISLQIEADFAGARPSIKDGYLQAKGKRWLLRAGRFKMPLSAFTLESPWNLPRAERGPLDDLLSDRMILSGRYEGAMARYDGGGYWDPALSLGAFTTVAGKLPDLTCVARLGVKPSGHEVALVGVRRVALVGGAARGYSAGGLDYTAELDDLGDGRALRMWAEARVGQGWHRQPVEGVVGAETTRSTFYEGRALAALRQGGAARDDKYAEVFFSAGLLDPDRLVIQDQFLEVSGGLNLGHWQRTRLTLEVVHARSGRNFPDSFYREEALPTVVRHTAVSLLLGAAF